MQTTQSPPVSVSEEYGSMRFNNKDDKPVNPKDTLSNYIRETHKVGLSLEMASVFTIIGMLAASGGWILNNQVGLEKRLTTLEAQNVYKQETLQKIERQLLELDQKLDDYLQKK